MIGTLWCAFLVLAGFTVHPEIEAYYGDHSAIVLLSLLVLILGIGGIVFLVGKSEQKPE